MSTATQARESIGERIRTLEQRLENRRLRFREDTEEAKRAAAATAVTARKWLPVAAAAGAGLLAFWLTRRTRSSRGSGDSVLPGATQAYADATRAQRRGVRWASLLGIVSTAYKFGTSPQARILLSALRRHQARRTS